MDLTRFWRWRLEPAQTTIESVVPAAHEEATVDIVDGVVRVRAGDIRPRRQGRIEASPPAKDVTPP